MARPKLTSSSPACQAAPSCRHQRLKQGVLVLGAKGTWFSFTLTDACIGLFSGNLDIVHQVGLVSNLAPLSSGCEGSVRQELYFERRVVRE